MANTEDRNPVVGRLTVTIQSDSLPPGTRFQIIRFNDGMLMIHIPPNTPIEVRRLADEIWAGKGPTLI